MTTPAKRFVSAAAWMVALVALAMPGAGNAATDIGYVVVGNDVMSFFDYAPASSAIEAPKSLSCKGDETPDAAATQSAGPETYAMLLAGLGLMGFIARRRHRVLNVTD
jgi:MYXO-CTERM domain-containing protein